MRVVSSPAEARSAGSTSTAGTKDKYDSGGRDGLFADPRVRLALNLAVNRDAIITKIFHGYALANASPVATVVLRLRAPGALPVRSRAARKALLAEAGWTDTNGDGCRQGRRAATLQLLFPAKHYGQAFDETTPAVVEMLKDVGVQVTVKPLDFGTLLQTVNKGTLPPNGGFAACRTSNNLDADDYVRDWASTTLVNWTPYPPELLRPLQGDAPRGRPQEAAGRARRPPAQVREWAPVVPLYQEIKVYAHAVRVLRFAPTRS